MKNASIRAVLLGLCILLPACSLFGLGDGDSSDLEANRKTWEKQQLTSYQFTLSRYCFCALGGDFTVTVKNGTISAAHSLLNDEPVSPENLQYLQTIDDLFVVIDEAMEDADVLDVTYDAERGYPTRIEIDYIKQAIDDEITYQAKDLSS